MVLWFDTHPAAYWIVAWTSFGLAAGVALVPLIAGLRSEALEARWLHRMPRWLFLVLTLLCLLAFRWPIWCVPAEFNPDESQFLAEALALQHRPVFWAAVDGTTHGPLDVFPLLLLRGTGLHYDYFGERLLATVLMLGLIYGCLRALAARSRESVARCAVLPLLALLAFDSYWDLVVYSSEVVPVALLAVGAGLLVSDLELQKSRQAWSGRWLAAGLLLGAVPMAKLQGAPVAAALLAGGAIWELTLGGVDRHTRWRRVGTLAASSLVPTILFSSIAWIAGAGADAWRSYIVQNVVYAAVGECSHLQMIQDFWKLVEQATGLAPFLAGAAWVAALCVPGLWRARAQTWRFVAFATIFLLVSFAAAIAPARHFPHYLLFVIAPAGLLAAALWQNVWQAAESWPRRSWFRAGLLLCYVGVLVVPQVVTRASAHHPYLGGLRGFKPLGGDPLTIELQRHAQPGEPLGMWGWRCRTYVETGLRPATREAHTYQQIFASPQRAYFRDRYLQDLERSGPPVFVDAVGPGGVLFTNRAEAHESFPALRAYLAAHYRQTAEIDGCRIYVRLDRLTTR